MYQRRYGLAMIRSPRECLEAHAARLDMTVSLTLVSSYRSSWCEADCGKWVTGWA